MVDNRNGTHTRMINNRFAVLLAEKQVKERRRIALSEVSTTTGISRSALQAWQANSVTRYDESVLNALCMYFGVQPGDLLQYIPDAEFMDYDDTPGEARGGLSDDDLLNRALDIGE